MYNSSTNQLLSFPINNSKHYLYLFILWPFLALIIALINYSQKEARKVVYIFLVYYGLTFVIGGEAVDAFAYTLRLQANAALPFSDFFKIVGGIYATDTSVDIVEPLISFIVSRFTSHHNILFAVYAAIFGYFYLKSISLLQDRYHQQPGINALIYMAFFTVILPITVINGFRMWTAAWIFFFGAYHVIIHKDARYLVIALASSLVHFSFLSANVVLIIYFFAGNRDFIYLPAAILSFILPNLMGPFFKALSLRLGGALQSRYEGYASEGYVLGVQESYEGASWFLTLSTDLVFYFLLLAIIIARVTSRDLMKGREERSLFSFLLLFLAFVNFGKGIPSFGERFQLVFFLFATLYVFIYFIKMPDHKLHILTLIGIFPMLLNFAVTFRIGSESINAWIFAPGLGLPLLVPSLSIAALIFY